MGSASLKNVELSADLLTNITADLLHNSAVPICTFPFSLDHFWSLTISAIYTRSVGIHTRFIRDQWWTIICDLFHISRVLRIHITQDALSIHSRFICDSFATAKNPVMIIEDSSTTHARFTRDSYTTRSRSLTIHARQLTIHSRPLAIHWRSFTIIRDTLAIYLRSLTIHLHSITIDCE